MHITHQRLASRPMVYLMKARQTTATQISTTASERIAEWKVELATECINILAVQPTVIKDIKPPVKVFGNLHGNYADLMRFFDIWKSPSESDKGDISGFDYLFLGNYVDRGAYSLETICLMMAIKVKYPK